MGIEKTFESFCDVGRKTISYFITDPFGESCLIGSYFTNKNGNYEIAYPLLAIGLYHTTRITINRIKLSSHIKKHGWSKRIVEKFSRTSWCSNRMLRAHSWGSKKYDEFEDIIKKYGTNYHIKEKINNAKIKLKKLRII